MHIPQMIDITGAGIARKVERIQIGKLVTKTKT